MQNLNKKIAAAFLVAAFAAPMMASADTASSSVGVSADVQAKIQLLLAQIKTLQEQIKNLVASSTAGSGIGWGMGSSTGTVNPGQISKTACITLNRSLRQGDSGDDVKNLQQMLQQDPNSGFTGSATGFFGPLTARAMMRFQIHNGIASSTDGSVGPLTRGFFQRRCGEGLDGTQGYRMGGQNGIPGMAQGDGSTTPVGPRGMMPTTNGPQNGPGLNGGPQNW